MDLNAIKMFIAIVQAGSLRRLAVTGKNIADQPDFLTIISLFILFSYSLIPHLKTD